MKKKLMYSAYVITIILAVILFKSSYAQKTNKITSDNYLITDKYIYAVPTSNDYILSELLDNITVSNLVEVYDKDNNKINNNDHVGTGYKLKVSDINLDIVVLGDVTGDGLIEIGDVSKIYNHYRGVKTFDGVDFEAGKLTGNDNIVIGDVSKLYNFFRGKKPFTYYSNEYPDGIPYNPDKVVDDVSSLRSLNANVGQIIQTNGYYSLNDGGGAKYEIESNSNQTIDNGKYIKLDNGKVAKLLVGRKTVNVKQFGAKGDGTTDEYPAFNNAINSGVENIFIPDGTYNINDHIITANDYVRLVGNGQNNSIVKNGSIHTQYGITAEEITFDGGANQFIDYVRTRSLDEDGTIIFDVTPNEPRDVIYRNCTFKNVTVASFAKDESKEANDIQIRNNIIENCTFTNIGKTAVYHNLALDKGVYINNTFSEIGATNVLKGFVSALFIGDITNNTYKEANELTIKGNTFTNLYTQDDFEENVHAINANFVAIRAYKALIDDNTVTNLIGYGHDREGIYTKVRDLTVSNNRLTNAGMGEGYICCKAHEGEAVFNIINNKMSGAAGTGIRDYGPGIVSGNVISIDNTYAAIVATLSGSISYAGKELHIEGNTFTSGTSTNLMVGDTEISKYSANRVMKITGITIPLYIENNNINTKTDYEIYISVADPGKYVTLKGNQFNLSQRGGTGFYIGVNGNETDATLSNETTIQENNFDVGPSFKVLTRTKLGENNSENSSRKYSFIDNTIKYNGTGEMQVFIGEPADGNGDTLIVRGNTTNSPKNKTTIKTNLTYFEMDNENFATVTLNYHQKKN